MVFPKNVIGLLCACVSLAACSASQTRTPRSTHNESFAIAGGQTISLPMTSAGPISAENEYAKILVAGFDVGPSKENAKQAVLAWGFDFEAKAALKKLETVKVEEVSPSATPVTLVEDSSPVLKNGVWSGNAEPIPANRTSTPWLYTSGKSVYVFRFTIKPVGEPAIILYQPTWFTGPAKQSFQRIIAQVEHG